MQNIKQILLILIISTNILFSIPTDSNITINNTAILELKPTFLKSPSALLKNIPQKKFLKNFYRKNKYKTLWLEDNALNEDKYSQLFDYIKNDITLNHKGLIYKNYQVLSNELDSNLTEMQTLRAEVKLTLLYYNFLKHTIYGDINWKGFSQRLSALKRKRINAAWIKEKPKFNIQKLMKQDEVTQTIESVLPKKFGYKKLLLALENLEELKEKGAWEELPYFKKLALGSSGDIVLKLRNRLKISGDYTECNETNVSFPIAQENNESIEMNLSRDAVFGHCLENSVKAFQKRHGLVVDGIAGRGTRGALNTPIEQKIEKVRLNIDRIKWLPRDKQDRYLAVNIPEFMLHYIEEGTEKQTLRVIVGDTKHPTPIFSERISYIVLNPYWKVPEGIVRREIVPAMVKDPNYLRKQGLEAHRTWDENSRKIDTTWLYWEDYLYGKKFPYRLMQPPGPKNALGKIKFKFPNRFSVYLHDTPTRHLFNRTVRAFSHGCVRLSNPRQLLETIATFNTNINIRNAKKTLKGKRKKQLNMKEKLRIYLIYLTTSVNAKGKLIFSKDIYNYDKYQKRRVQ